MVKNYAHTTTNAANYGNTTKIYVPDIVAIALAKQIELGQ